MLDQLQERIGYRFNAPELLKTAFIHPSWKAEHPECPLEDNQRLEFLGDSVLNLLSARMLYPKCPDLNEGELTVLRSRITSGKTLAAKAFAAGLGNCLKLGNGEENSGGRDRASNLEDAIEALFGAAFLDGGLEAAGAIFDVLFPSGTVLEDDDVVEDTNPRALLQKKTQALSGQLPIYTVLNIEGPHHAPLFTAEASFGERRVRASGYSKQKAFENAALEMLKLL